MVGSIISEEMRKVLDAYNNIDKAIEIDPNGPWENVRNDVSSHGFGPHEFQFFDMNCSLERSYAWCGYITLPENNPFYGLSSFEEIRELEKKYKIKVHGNITFFTKDCIGFDTSHYRDISLHTIVLLEQPDFLRMFTDGNNYRHNYIFWTFEKAKEELRNFAEQISKLNLSC